MKKTVYIVTRVDGTYCPVCEVFKTKEEAEAFIKEDFAKLRYSWGGRFSMVAGFEDQDCFPIRECDGGAREWDIHEREIEI